MTTLELIDRLANIFLDLVLPLAVLWLGSLIKQWLPGEAHAHKRIEEISTALHNLRSSGAEKSST